MGCCFYGAARGVCVCKCGKGGLVDEGNDAMRVSCQQKRKQFLTSVIHRIAARTKEEFAHVWSF